jgi:tetratricopeptide (TPR) repeat protein
VDRDLATRLMALPALERLAAALHDTRYHRPTLARMLVLRAESELFEPGCDARPTAEVAAAVASLLPRDPEGKAGRTAAVAHWLLGKALLEASQWRLAEGAFEAMFASLRDPRPSEERGLAGTGLAQLLAEMGNVDGAVAQFLLAASCFSKIGMAAPTTACQAQLGLLLVATGDLATARHPLRAALALIDPGLAPSLAARLHLALAEVEAILGDLGGAAEQVRRARGLYRLVPSPAEAVARRWREARVAAAAGEPDEAEAHLDVVRRELVAHGSVHEAARATLEHLLVRGEGQESVDVHEITAALAAGFPGAGELYAGAIADVVRHAAGRPPDLPARCQALQRRLRHDATLARRDRPRLLTRSRALADRLLRGVGELEDPIGAAAGL